jgi:hypothetical protein
MKKASILLSAVAGLVLIALATPTFAAEEGKEKEKTITGEAKCAKCALKEADKCQTVLQVEGKNGKTETFYLADNEVAKKFHGEICKGPKKVHITGTVKKVEGKNELTATKIEPVKEKEEKEKGEKEKSI